MDGDSNPDQGITDEDSNPDESSFLQVDSNPNEGSFLQVDSNPDEEKTKPPSSGGPSHTANANARSPSTNQLYPTLSLLTTNAHARFPSSNQFYPTTRLSTTNVQTSLPLSNQSPNYSWSCSPPNFTFTSVLQSQKCMTHLNQDVFPYDFEEHQDACNS
ncbi:hypothetical protein C1H46_018040 [Malus baccata]|uniref:Uncharacterized protein n=1 Tax=Malus baccata TaxID=106549 RepID=A0A540MC06_MALBA|nr:hypothetical protein C1H46_018040 [Malus baccata]